MGRRREYDLVLVGAGQAAASLLSTLHRLGFSGSILIIGDEPVLPYQRPPLSKQFLKGTFDEQRLLLRPERFYIDAGIVVELSSRVVDIDRTAKTVITEQGERVGYRQLVLLTGARVRRLDLPGAELDGVRYLRTLDDAREIRRALESARRVAVIGGGFIGLEFAAVARELGCEVAVFEAQSRLMARALVPYMSDYFAALHRRHGVDIRLGCALDRLEGQGGRIGALVTAEGERMPVDLALIGIGVVPNQGLAEGCGLNCDNGIAVDAFGRTSDPSIFAAGDCASHRDPRLGARVRLESVQNATDQAAALAATLVGQQRPYDALPWFWSEQYDVRLQMAGLSAGVEREVLRGDPDEDSFSLFYFRQGRLQSVDSVNRPADHVHARRLLSQGNSLSPEQAADPEFALLQALKTG